MNAATLRKMLDMGLTLEQAAELAEVWEAGAQAEAPVLSKGAVRTRKWRERLDATGLSGEEWRALSARIVSRDGGRCRYCGTGKGRMCTDHVTPLIQGGDNSDANLVCACEACNGGKSGRSVEEWKGGAWAAQWRTGAVTSDVTRDNSHVGERTQVVTPSLPSLRSEELKIPPEKPTVSTPKGADSRRGTRLADNWRPDQTGLRYAVDQLGQNVDPERELDRFRDYWRAVPGAKGRKLDWPGTWRNWCRNAADRLPRKAPHERPHHDAKLAAKQANYARAWEGSERAIGQRGEP